MKTEIYIYIYIMHFNEFRIKFHLSFRRVDYLLYSTNVLPPFSLRYRDLKM